MSIKMDRLNTAFIETISEILHNDIKDSSIKHVTLTECRITNDLSFAKIYFTTCNENKEDILYSLNKASSFIRSELCNKIKIRKMPEIKFVYDDSYEYGKKIDDIIERINNDKED